MNERGFAGIAYGLAAYGMWGFFPLFFRQLGHVPPMDVLCNRAAWCCAFVACLIALGRRWHKVQLVLRRPRQIVLLATAGMLVGSNWLIFLYAVDQRQVIASSLGYFVTPLVNIALGMVVLKERLNRLEWGAVALAGAAVLLEFVTLGKLPWISLALAGTFGLYGLVRKQVPVDALTGLWVETLAMLPVAFAYTLWQAGEGHAVYSGHDAQTAMLLAVAGIVTAVPLMAFAAATQRLNLATVGMLMYINPTLQFTTAVWLFGEPLTSGRMLTFVLIWAGLALYSWAAWNKYRAKRGELEVETPVQKT